MRTALIAAVGLFTTANLSLAADTPAQRVVKIYELNIPRQSLDKALKDFAQQTGLQVARLSDSVSDGALVGPVAGNLSVEQALKALLEEQGLAYKVVDDLTIAVVPRTTANAPSSVELRRNLQLAQSDQPSQSPPSSAAAAESKGNFEELQELSVDIPEILVSGSKILNMDIRRSPDDIQPYVIFDRQVIEESGAANIQDFLKNRLPMATTSISNGQVSSESGNTSSISLRGLGTEQTLILVDGHRIAGAVLDGASLQPDLNGIPLAAIERIEVLPTTASGIYGGGATGGVINVILRRDYSGFEARVTYDSALDFDVSRRQLDMSAGFALEGGRTNVMLTGTISDGESLKVGERGFLQRARAHILAHSPSAFFGNPFALPVGTTTNIAGADLNTFEFRDLTLKDGTPLNSSFTFVPSGYAGSSSDAGNALVANAGHYDLRLANTAQFASGRNLDLLNYPNIESVMASVRREFTPRIQGFLDLAASNNSSEFAANGAGGTFTIPATSPNNPFAQDIQVSTPILGGDGLTVSTTYTRRVVGGIIVKLPANWQAEADYTWNRTRFYSSTSSELIPDAALAIANGDLDVLRDTNAFATDFLPFIDQPGVRRPVHTVLQDTNLRIAGPLLSLPAGPIALSALIEHREESYGDALYVSSSFSQFNPHRSQEVDSIYLEAKIPVISANNPIPAVRLLEIQAAGRWDDYTLRSASGTVDNGVPITTGRFKSSGSSIDPTLGLRYQPLADVMLRASYGKGYLPPNVGLLVDSPPIQFGADIAALLGLTDPLRGGEPLGDFDYFYGGSSALRPEHSTSQSAGLVLTPRLVPGLRLSADWIRIKKTDNLAALDLAQQSIESEAFAPGLIVRGEPTEGDPFGVGPIVAFNGAFLNIARARVESLDISADYSFDTAAAGHFDLSAGASHLIRLQNQIVATAPSIDSAGVAGTATGGLDWKGYATLRWDYRDWTLAWTARYFDGYWVNATHTIDARQGSATVPSQTYHDLFASYRIGAASPGLFASTEINLGINNVFDKTPPIDIVSSAALGYSPWGDPRGANFILSLRKAF